MPRAETLTDVALAPLDRARTALWRAATAWPALRALVIRRDTRVALAAGLGVLVTLALVTLAPMVVFAVSPLVLGVPHVASDVRYLMLRPRLPRAWLLLGAGAITLMIAARALQVFVMPRFPAAFVEGGLVFAWMFAGAWLGAKDGGRPSRLAWLLPLVAGAAVVVATHPRAALVVFPHLHNLVALALWTLLFRQHRRFALPPLLLVAAGTALFASGATLPWAEAAAGTSFLGASLRDAGALLAPGASEAIGVRVALVYIFLQSVHYAVWLGWIPQDQLRGEGTLSFRQTARGLRRDFGAVGIAAIVLSLPLLWALAARDLYGTREAYLLLANFHGLLEVATLVFLVAAGRRLVVDASAPRA